MSTIPKSYCKSIKNGSMVRVNLPMFEGVLAVGRVCDIQIVYLDGQTYTFVWVDMTIDGVKRQFSPENLDILPNVVNGFCNDFVADLISEAH